MISTKIEVGNCLEKLVSQVHVTYFSKVMKKEVMQHQIIVIFYIYKKFFPEDIIRTWGYSFLNSHSAYFLLITTRQGVYIKNKRR